MDTQHNRLFTIGVHMSEMFHELKYSFWHKYIFQYY
jgi:hypothetical protein